MHKHNWETDSDDPSWFCLECGLEFPTRQLADECRRWHEWERD